MKKIVFTLVSMAVSVSAFAQNLPVGGFNPDVRTAGMADTYTSSYGRGFSIYTNSAAAALSDDTFAVDLNYSNLMPKTGTQTGFAAGAYYKFAGRYTVALGARGVLFPSMTGMDENAVPYEISAPKNMSFDASFGMRIIDGLAAAVNFHYFMADYVATGNGFAADVDLMYSHEYFNVALSAKNLGPAINYSDGMSYAMPAEIRAGASGCYSVIDGALKISPAADASYGLYSSAVTVGVGADFRLFDILSVRGGYRYSSDIAMLPTYATVGLGVDFFGVSVNAAYYLGLSDSPVDGAFKIGLGYSF